jgi:hypothetical protein
MMLTEKEHAAGIVAETIMDRLRSEGFIDLRGEVQDGAAAVTISASTRPSIRAVSVRISVTA